MRASRRKTVLSRIVLAGYLLVAAWPGLTARPPVLAQGGLPADQQVLLDRVTAALAATEAYTRYETAVTTTWQQDWRGTVDDQVVAGQTVDHRREQHMAASQTPDGPNLSQTVVFRHEESAPGMDPVTIMLAGLLRRVDGRFYARAAYSRPYPDGSRPVPQGWVEVTDDSLLDLYPGLENVISREALAAPEPFLPGPVSQWIDVTQLQETLPAQAVEVSSATGDQGETIRITLRKPALLDLGIFFEPGEPISDAVYDLVEGEPLIFTFTLDSADNLIDLAYTFDLTLVDLNMSGVADAPMGFTVNAALSETLRMQIVSANAPLALAVVPEELGGPPPVVEVPAIPADLPWWNDRVFYEVFVRSFHDSDGDGIGDLRGLIEQLDYLNDGDPTTTDDLGVTGLWLMPIAESPSYHGYDVTDYERIEADYGTNQDFQDLMAAAHARGIVVIVDLVLNHTSSEHPWFLASEAGDPAFADWYEWSDSDPGVFAPWGSPAWHQAADGRYYYSIFWEGMPDLNYNTPAVTEEMYRVIRFWLEDMGVDGFRLDAIKHLFERGSQVQDLPETLAWLEDFHSYVRSLNPDALTVGEVWSPTPIVAMYAGDRVDIAFEFDLATAILQAVQTGNGLRLREVQRVVLDSYAPGQYAAFLTNHDQDRVLNTLHGDEGAARVAATLLLTNPGVPFIYYGEEVGMSGAKPDERIRTPMAWNDDRVRAGFTTGIPWERLADGYRTHNVALEASDPDSLLNHYAALIALRAAYPALRTGSMQLLPTGSDGVYSFLRCGEDEAVLVLVNLSREAVADYGLAAAASCLAGMAGPELLLGAGPVTGPELDSEGGFSGYRPLAVLPAQSSTLMRFR